MYKRTDLYFLINLILWDYSFRNGDNPVFVKKKHQIQEEKNQNKGAGVDYSAQQANHGIGPRHVCIIICLEERLFL